ncbi:MAG: sulfatase [Planctomycetota bacterium]|nr:sulfatase [Planctomycetota bacterium]
MNVILIVTDTWRRDHMGCYGNLHIRTPHLDELAKRSAVFDNAWCGSYTTLPHRNDVVTGRYDFPWRGWSGPGAGERTLPGLLGRAGKSSFLITDTYHHWGKGASTFWWDFTGFEFIRGQERDPWISDTDMRVKFPAPEYKETGSITPHLRMMRTRSREEDWSAAQVFLRATYWFHHNTHLKDSFLMVDAFDPHEPWDPPRKYSRVFEEADFEGDEYISPSSRPLAGYMSEAEFRHVKALYAGEISLVDRWIGHLIKQVRNKGALENTLIVVTSNGGVLLGEHGLVGKEHMLYQDLARVPLIVWHPTLAHGRRIDQLVQPVDILPTVLEAAGIEPPADLHGRSLLPLLGETPPKPAWRQTALIGWHGKWCNLTDGRYILHCSLESGAKLLFDTQRDPDESKDLAMTDGAQLQRMEELLAARLREIQAPATLAQRLALKAQ